LSFRRVGTNLIEPMPIPPFTPVARILRRDGVVI